MVDKLLSGQLSTARKKKASGPILGIFAKEPLPGQVKTRLCPPLTKTEAAELYRVSLIETVARMRRGSFPLSLFYDGRDEFFRATFPDIPCISQGRGDLGQRMERALSTLLGRGHVAAALVGSDSPDLPVLYVEKAFALLQKNDIVTIPARDGGYILIGARQNQPALFRDIPWSTPAVLAATRCRAQEQAIGYCELASWEDVDDHDALQRLVQRSPGSETAKFVLNRLAHYL